MNFYIGDASLKLYRGDDRIPEDIFKNGFVAKGTKNNIIDFIEYNEESIFIGTSKSAIQASMFASKKATGGFVYIIDKHGTTIDANGFYLNVEGFPNPRAHEEEVIFENVIFANKVLGAFKIDKDKKIIGDIIINSNYQP